MSERTGARVQGQTGSYELKRRTRSSQFDHSGRISGCRQHPTVTNITLVIN